MVKPLKVYQVDSFTTERFRGNPAGVVLDADGLTEQQMQDIARELNNSETAFILSPTNTDHDVWIRFFTPTMEVPICGHATIAAHYVRALENNLGSCRIIHKTGSGILPIDIIKNGNNYKIVMTQGKPKFKDINNKNTPKILKALGLKNEDLDERCPIQLVSTGGPKVIVGIKSKEKLNAIEPDLASLKQLSSIIGTEGYFIFTFDSDNKNILTHGRMFAPDLGINEDPVTGMANGPLGAYIIYNNLIEHDGKEFVFKSQQGEAIKRAGIVETTEFHQSVIGGMSSARKPPIIGGIPSIKNH